MAPPAPRPCSPTSSSSKASHRQENRDAGFDRHFVIATTDPQRLTPFRRNSNRRPPIPVLRRQNPAAGLSEASGAPERAVLRVSNRSTPSAEPSTESAGRARCYLLVGMPPGDSGLSESDHHHPEVGVPGRTCRLPGKSRVSCEPHRNPTSRRHGGRWPPCSCGPGGYCRTGHVESLTFGPFRPLPTGPRATVRRG